IDSVDSPPAPTVANGVPLSVRNRCGRPYSRNVASNNGRTCVASVPWCIAWQRKITRLCASEIVSGSQRIPSPVRTQPLKPQHRRADFLRDRIGMVPRRARVRLQAIQPLGTVVRRQLVARLATDLERATQLSHAGLVLGPAQHKLEALFHG